MARPHIYLASGWFNPEQKRQMDEVYEVLCELKAEDKIDFFSPFYNGVVLKMGDPDFKKKMKEVWALDINELIVSEMVVACTQDSDVGTVFECGYASAKKIPILCFNSIPEFGLNLMLAQEARGFVKSKKDLRAAIESFIKALEEWKEEDWHWNLWQGETI